MNSVRGEDKTPGELRKDQNWIGKPNSSVEQATFVPPDPLRLSDHLEAWREYVNSADFDALVQAGIVHAQFELIHPFFLNAITAQATKNTGRVQAILTYYNEMKDVVREITRSQHSALLVNALFDRPIFRFHDVASRHDSAIETAQGAC